LKRTTVAPKPSIYLIEIQNVKFIHASVYSSNQIAYIHPQYSVDTVLDAYAELILGSFIVAESSAVANHGP